MVSSPSFVASLPLPASSASTTSARSRRPSVMSSPPRRHPVSATLAAPPSVSPAASPSPDTPTFVPGTVHAIPTPHDFDALCRVADDDDALILADFMALWCRKCKYLLPRLRKLAACYPNVYFCTVDVNRVERLPRQFEIAKMPTFVFRQRGRVVHTLVGGAAPQVVADQLESLVEKYAAEASPSQQPAPSTSLSSTPFR